MSARHPRRSRRRGLTATATAGSRCPVEAIRIVGYHHHSSMGNRCSSLRPRLGDRRFPLLTPYRAACGYASTLTRMSRSPGVGRFSLLISSLVSDSRAIDTTTRTSRPRERFAQLFIRYWGRRWRRLRPSILSPVYFRTILFFCWSQSAEALDDDMLYLLIVLMPRRACVCAAFPPDIICSSRSLIPAPTPDPHEKVPASVADVVL